MGREIAFCIFEAKDCNTKSMGKRSGGVFLHFGTIRPIWPYSFQGFYALLDTRKMPKTKSTEEEGKRKEEEKEEEREWRDS